MTIQIDAQTALDKSDITVLRAVETGTQIPAEWVAYRVALRGIVSGTNAALTLPVIPDYPSVSIL